jgi:hypothetical protein
MFSSRRLAGRLALPGILFIGAHVILIAARNWGEGVARYVMPRRFSGMILTKRPGALTEQQSRDKGPID